MLELDQILAHFVDRHAQYLNDLEQKLLIRLLDYTDPVLYAWLLKRSVVPDVELRALVAWIRHDYAILPSSLTPIG